MQSFEKMTEELTSEGREASSTLYRELDASAFSDDSTWMNLGLWSSLSRGEKTKLNFTEANIALATRIGDLALLGTDAALGLTTIVDLGCGNGDSLQLWANTPRYHQMRRIIGVNSSKSEYLFASDRLKNEPRISVHLADAVGFIEKPEIHLNNFAVVSVDAAYHFLPSREAFLRACHTSGAMRISLSDIVLSERWARERGRMDFLTTTFRDWFIRLICWAGGIPLVNLSYGPIELDRLLDETGWNITQFETVTADVFLPFSKYCFGRAEGFTWLSKTKWTLLSSGMFMSLLSWMNAVDFVIYACDRKRDKI